MGPQVQPKCFRHPQHMRNNWESEAISSGLATRRLYFKKKRTFNGHFSRPAQTDLYVFWNGFYTRKSKVSFNFWNPQILLFLLLPSGSLFDNHERAWKIHFWDPPQWDKMCFECQRIKLQWKKGPKFSHLLTVRTEGAEPPPHPLQSVWL